jgi:selenocysteine lyase/cysteine desulfurase
VEKSFIYMDNGATSFPKPQEVISAWVDYSVNIGASPGRGNYGPATQATQLIDAAREKAASFFGIKHVKRLAFTKNATERS